VLGKIKSIEEVVDFEIKPVAKSEGSGGKLGLSQMITGFYGYSCMDGYKVKTDKHSFYILIDNGQSCCEEWGYISCAEDELDLKYFLGSQLIEVNLTDVALNQTIVDNSGYYEEDGGIQFIDFKTNIGTFQLAVYNAHNGYYGHGIIVAKDEEILLNDTI